MASVAAACGDPSPLLLSLRVDPDIVAQAALYEARVFTRLDCADLELIEGRLDRVLTSTPTLHEKATAPDGFAPIDLSTLAGDLALDLRATAADGTLLARRCTPVASTTEEAVVGLARFADPGTRVVAVETTALVAGDAQRPARVQVLTDAGPAPRVYASIGADRPLLRSDAQGFITIDTSSVTLEAGQPRDLVVFGVVGSRTRLTSEALPGASCPTSTWSREIVPGLAGAQIGLAAADAGPRSLIALLRPRTATSSLNAIELLAADEGATSLRSLTTATTSASGEVALAADRTTGAAVVLVVRADGVAEIRRYDAASNRFGPTARADLGLVPGGAIDGLRGAWLTPGGATFVAFGDVPGGAVLVGTSSTSVRRLPGEDRVVVDLSVSADRVQLTTPRGLERLAWVGGELQPDGALVGGVGGRLLPLGGGSQAHTLALDGTVARTVGEVGIIDTATVAAAPLALAAGDVNGDGLDDTMLLTNLGSSLLLTAPSGRMVPSLTCPFDGGPRTVVALPLDRGGRARWATVLDQTGRLALWIQP